MLFIHAGTDYVGVGYPGWYERIPRNGVEYAFPARLIEITKNHDISSIYLIQWPGWFTNIRVVCLALTMLQSLHNHRYSIFSATKIDIYTQLHEKKFLPTDGYVYIGQRKNRRSIDLNQKKHTITSILIGKEKKSDFFYDYIHDRESIEIDERWRDFMQSYMIEYVWKDSCMYILYKGQLIDLLQQYNRWDVVSALVPRYGIDPNIHVS